MCGSGLSRRGREIAGRAEERRALRLHDALDGRAAPRTRRTRAAVDLEGVGLAVLFDVDDLAVAFVGAVLVEARERVGDRGEDRPREATDLRARHPRGA